MANQRRPRQQESVDLWQMAACRDFQTMKTACMVSPSACNAFISQGGNLKVHAQGRGSQGNAYTCDYHDIILPCIKSEGWRLQLVFCAFAGVAWSSVDPWTFASLSYDGRVSVHQVPSNTKYKILI